MGIDPQSLDMERQQRQEAASHSQAGPGTTTEYGAAQASAIEAGTTVYTSDGKHLGSVKQVKGGYFELDREGEADYWLSQLYVVSNDGERAYLNVPMDEVPTHRLQQPGLEMLDRGLSRFGTKDETNMEALHTRELMERELREQRGTIDTGLERGGAFR